MFERKKYDKNGFDENGYNKLGFDKFGYNKQGFDKDGYDKRGFNAAGFHKLTGLNKDGFDKDGYDKTGFNSDGYDRDGYDHDGYNKNGYNRDGFNALGFDINGFGKDGYTIDGFDKNGFDRSGYNKQGYDANGFDKDGYNVNGFDKQGFNRQGFNAAGFDVYGFDVNGYDVTGYDRDGFSRDGFDRKGYDRNGYDANGYNADGFDSDGYDKNGYNADGYDADGYNADGYDASGFNKSGFDKSGYNAEGFDVDGYDRAGFNSKGFDRNGYDKWGYNEAGFNFEGYDIEGYNKDGYDRKGFNRQGYDQKGYDKDGYNSEGYNRAGFDRNGFNKEGFDKYGFAVDGYDLDGFDVFGRDREGYGLTGYDKAGFNREGFNQDGFHKDDFDERGFNKYTGLNANGYDREGYNVNGLNAAGFDRDGFDIDGVDKDGYNRDGYNHYGYNRRGYDCEGYNRSGYNESGFDRLGYNKDGFDKLGYNRLGFDKEGYDKNGLNVNGKRKALITSPEQIQYGLRIKNKKTGERGRIDARGKTRVFYTMDNHRGTSIRTEATIENFMNLFFLDDDGMGADHERESLYHTKVRQFLYSNYRDSVLIPRERSKVNLRERTYIDRSGLWVTEKDSYDELQLRLNAEATARKIAGEAYFAHVDYKGDPDLYIGKKAIPGYVVDWADKRAAYYYEYKIYTVDQQLGINFVRDITLKNGMFSDFHDLYNRKGKVSGDSGNQYASVADEKLIEIIERNRTSKAIHDIVESIQEKQYEIITQDMDKGYLVLGCAGSGKTMILLHRIRYILFNNPDVDTNSLVIVSPTDILGRESKELAKILNIDKVNQRSTASFYTDIIRDIFDANGLFHRVEEFQICDSNTNVENNAVTSCLDIISGKLLQKRFYVSAAQKKLADEKKQTAATIGEINLLNGNSYYLKAMTELATCSGNDISTIIQYAKTKVDTELPIKKNRELALLYLLECLRKGSSKKEEYDEIKIRRRFQRVLAHVDKFDFAAMESVRIETKQPVTRFVQAVSLLSDERDEKEIKQTIDDIKGLTYGEVEHMAYLVDAEIDQLKKLDRIREALESTVDVVDYIGEDSLNIVTAQEIISRFENLLAFIQNVEQTCEAANVNPFVIFGEYNDIEKELQMLNNANCSDDYVFDMLLRQMNIERDRRDRKITINKQQLQKILHVLIEKFGIPDKRRFYIFLDEFQDYSTEELTDIQKYFSNAVINLYGDVNQCINASGINDISTLRRIMSFDGEYELKENYRNSSEITAYVNKRFGMDMYKIGLPGSVKESKLFSLGELENDDRGAIIIADESILEQLSLSDEKAAIRYYNEEGAIQKNCYNVLTVAQAKGLEFEKVIVIDKDMTKNQLYVACTRAIRDLDVVSLQNRS